MKVQPLGDEFRTELTEEAFLAMANKIDELVAENNSTNESLITLWDAIERLETRTPAIARPF